MTKKEIVLKISEETGIKQVIVKQVVHKVFDSLFGSLLKGNKIEIRNFGVFKVKIRRKRIGRNPHTNQPIPLPARKVVVFKPGLEMKKRIK